MTDEINGQDKQKADSLLGAIDTTYLLSYALFQFPNGMIADRLDLRYFLTFGCLSSGVMTILFGAGKYMKIHSLYYFIFIQVIST